MADGDEGQERTEEPTEKRREEAREKGQVAQSRELITVMVFLAAVGVFAVWRQPMLDGVMRCMGHFFQFGAVSDMNVHDVTRALAQAVLFGFAALSPLFAAVFCVGVAAHVMQFGFLYSPAKLEMKPEKINPLSGLMRMMSLRQGMEGVKHVVKLGLIATIVWYAFRDEIARIGQMTDMTPRGMLDHITWAALKMTWKVSIFLVGLAVLDFGYQRWEHTRSLRMSRQEIKDEMKEREGDPLIKQRIRQIAAERARQRMMEAVPKADVVVTNPTHLAVALQYDRDSMRAPKVTAKGAGFIALKIRELAQANGVPIVENKPVARILFKTVKIGGETPVSLYKAIAGILAYVYKTARRKPRWI